MGSGLRTTDGKGSQKVLRDELMLLVLVFSLVLLKVTEIQNITGL